jgi:hypothetical protein
MGVAAGRKKQKLTTKNAESTEKNGLADWSGSYVNASGVYTQVNSASRCRWSIYLIFDRHIALGNAAAAKNKPFRFIFFGDPTIV